MDDRSVRLRVVWLSLMVLAALAAFNATLHPLVKGFGLAHSRWLDSDIQPVLVVDSVAREDVGAIMEMFPAEVRGMHGFRVYEILLPSVIMAVAMGVLAHFLGLHGRSAAAWLWSRRPRLELPPSALVAGLGLGALAGLRFGSDWSFPRDAILMPFVLAILGMAAVSLQAWPDARRLSGALTALHATRWFWLGFVAIWQGANLFTARPEIHLCTPPSWQMTPGAVTALLISFLLFHWSTRVPRRVSLSMVSGDCRHLLETCERLTQLAIGELWVVLPLVLATVAHSPAQNALPLLCPYLLLSSASAAMARWTLEGHPPQSRSWTGRLASSLWRAGTVALILALPLLVLGQAASESLRLPIAIPFILIGVGLLGGRPWRTQKRACDFAVRTQPVQTLSLPRAGRTWSSRTRRAAVGALLALGVTVISSAHQEWSPCRPAESAEVAVKHKVEAAFGYRARLLQRENHTLILSLDLSAYDVSRAEQMVRMALPDDRVSVIPVSIWRWELAGFGFLLLTLSAVLSGLPVLLLRKTSGPAFTAPFSLLAGANGAFALGAKWGWFWLDPYIHLAAFGICTVMAGAGTSWALRPRAITTDSPAVEPDQAMEAIEPIAAEAEPESAPAIAEHGPEPAAPEPRPSVLEWMRVDALGIEVGRDLIKLIEPGDGAKLFERVTSIRRHVAMELGLAVPGIRFRDNLQLKSGSYIIKLRDVQVAQGQVRLDQFLAIAPEDVLAKLDGDPTRDPTYAMPGKWIDASLRAEAERLGCMLFDAVSVVATQLTEVIASHACELLTLETMGQRMRHLSSELPITVETVRQQHSLLTLRDVYRTLLEERVSVRDDETILNALAGAEGSLDSLVASVRLALRRGICSEHTTDEGVINVLALTPALEKELLACLRGGRFPDGSLEKIKAKFSEPMARMNEKGLRSILLTHPRLRQPLFRLLRDKLGMVVVLASNETDLVKVNVVERVGGSSLE